MSQIVWNRKRISTYTLKSTTTQNQIQDLFRCSLWYSLDDNNEPGKLVSPSKTFHMNYHLDGHGLHGTLLASAAQKACRRRCWKLMLYCLGLLGRDGKWKYVIKKLLLYSVEDTNRMAVPDLRDKLVDGVKKAKQYWPRPGRPPQAEFLNHMRDLILLVCAAPKSRLCDHAICASPKWLLDIESKEGKQPRKYPQLAQTFVQAIKQRDWKRSIALMYLCRILFPNTWQQLWRHCPESETYAQWLRVFPGQWSQELLMVESLLTMGQPWASRDVQKLDWYDNRQQATVFWDKLMQAPLNYQLRSWIRWDAWLDKVWDKHTFRGNGGNSAITVRQRFPDLPDNLTIPDGPPLEHTSKMQHFFDVGAFLPEPALVDPFWQEAKTFFVQLETLKRHHTDYVAEKLQIGSYSKQRQQQQKFCAMLHTLALHKPAAKKRKLCDSNCRD